MEIETMVRETFNNYHKSMVMILKRIGDKLNASNGFIIGRKNTSCLVMTCSHCINHSDSSDLKLSARLSGKTKEYDCKVLHDDVDIDLAIIQVIDVPEGEECPVFQFCTLGATRANTPIVQIGYLFSSTDQLNLEPAAFPGTIMIPLCQNGQMDVKNVVYQAASKHGCSGSAVVLESKVIGVLYAVSLSSQTSFARSSDTVGRVLMNWLKIAHDVTIDQMIDSIVQKM